MLALLTDSVSPNLARSLRYLLMWGLEGVALRGVGTAVVPHVNEVQLRHRLAEDDIPLVSVEPGLFQGGVEDRVGWMNDIASLPDTVAFSHRTQNKRIIVDCLPESEDIDEAVRVLADAAAQVRDAGLSLCVRNSGWAVSPKGWELLNSTASGGAIQIAWDPATVLEDPESFSRQSVPSPKSLGVVFVRDVGGGSASGVIPGEGEVGWDEIAKSLVGAGFEGPWVLDVRAERPAKAGLSHAAALIGLLRQARRAHIE